MGSWEALDHELSLRGHREQLLVSWGAGRFRDLVRIMQWVPAGVQEAERGRAFPSP